MAGTEEDILKLMGEEDEETNSQAGPDAQAAPNANGKHWIDPDEAVHLSYDDLQKTLGLKTSPDNLIRKRWDFLPPEERLPLYEAIVSDKNFNDTGLKDKTRLEYEEDLLRSMEEEDYDD